MKKSRFTEEQIIAILRKREAVVATAGICRSSSVQKSQSDFRKNGVSSATFYRWKARFGGMDVSQARRLKALEDENQRLKWMLADTMLDNAALKDLPGKGDDARRFRTLAVVDACTRDSLALVADNSLSGLCVARALDDVISRARNSLFPIRRREMKIQGFKSLPSAQHFPATHAAICNACVFQRHMISRPPPRLFRARANGIWTLAAV